MEGKGEISQFDVIKRADRQVMKETLTDALAYGVLVPSLAWAGLTTFAYLSETFLLEKNGNATTKPAIEQTAEANKGDNPVTLNLGGERNVKLPLLRTTQEGKDRVYQFGPLENPDNSTGSK